ncbi:MAG: SigB/SigF/SigG family RNA polymerase sigma factor [Candidatus Geothermincolia bacterium]
MVKRDPEWYQARKEQVKRLFEEFRERPSQQIRDELTALHLDLVQFLARRFANRGEPMDDLVQVGFIGLIKAIDRFDLDRGVDFTTYATPTIVGEIKRHFRDRGWAIRIPRSLQMRDAEVNQTVDVLSQRLKRSPTLAEIAGYMGVSVDEVVEILATSHATHHLSLEGSMGNEDDDSFTLLDNLGLEDSELIALENKTTVAALLAKLTPREQHVVYMRFFRGMTQIEIAKELDISQMHVSRLLTKILKKLRDSVTA